MIMLIHLGVMFLAGMAFEEFFKKHQIWWLLSVVFLVHLLGIFVGVNYR